jgi:hypothetical protein
VAVIDNTGDPNLSQWIQAFSQMMNALREYNPRYPVILYYQNVLFAPGNPCAAGPSQYVVLCRSETLDPSAPSGAASSTALTLDSKAHIIQAVTRFRPSAVDGRCPADRFALVLRGFSAALGLGDNPSDPASALYPTFAAGRCTYNGYTLADLDRLTAQYNHAVG